MIINQHVSLRALKASSNGYAHAPAALFVLPLISSSHTTTTSIRTTTPFSSRFASSQPRPYSSTTTTTTTSSASSAATTSKQSKQEPVLPPTPTPTRAPNHRHAAPLDPEAANPPATTRPPPLTLPDRAPGASAFSFGHLLATGKAYLSFYKTGLSYLWTNRQLVRALSPLPPQNPKGSRSRYGSSRTRAEHQLRARWRHDAVRLPAFGILLLAAGEMTPFVVLVVPALVPLTCRIPAQESRMQRAVEDRRRAAFAALRRTSTSSSAGTNGKVNGDQEDALHMARVLGVGSRLWDAVLPSQVAGLVLRGAVRRRVAFLARDDALLRGAGGAAALEAAEVRIACAERGIDVLGRGDEELRGVLASWLRIAGGGGGDGEGVEGEGDEEGIKRIERLLRVPEGEWE